jgi:hypothetical protein
LSKLRGSDCIFFQKIDKIPILFRERFLKIMIDGMKIALEEAQRAFEEDEVPVGACIIREINS